MMISVWTGSRNFIADWWWWAFFLFPWMPLPTWQWSCCCCVCVTLQSAPVFCSAMAKQTTKTETFLLALPTVTCWITRSTHGHHSPVVGWLSLFHHLHPKRPTIQRNSDRRWLNKHPPHLYFPFHKVWTLFFSLPSKSNWVFCYW